MHNPLTHTDLLRLIDERHATFRRTIHAAPTLDTKVPTCPDWTLHQLAEHIGQGRRSWAATVTAADPTSGRLPDTDPAPHDRTQLDTWLTTAAGRLIDALRTAGPDQPVWTWWPTAQSPQTSGAVARHQLQEIAVHTYDAQLTTGDPQPLPTDIALDGVEEFLHTVSTTTTPWPHTPATIAFTTTEGPTWHLRLDHDGAYTVTPDGPADTTLTGTASNLVLLCYGREPDGITLTGDPTHVDRLIEWDPS
ncbi:maleylpyruvate isomerase family mycothiol-dependent enzyme [Actinoplanes sp. G11-F43]|uniref:maleylpyruvate isomerase family mycothiol-dependent enzyme n=1 Tax=Actinoplanes sp. G11-F43 TaxID=3424130 RepID=UPI003D3492B8